MRKKKKKDEADPCVRAFRFPEALLAGRPERPPQADRGSPSAPFGSPGPPRATNVPDVLTQVNAPVLQLTSTLQRPLWGGFATPTPPRHSGATFSCWRRCSHTLLFVWVWQFRELAEPPALTKRKTWDQTGYVMSTYLLTFLPPVHIWVYVL